MPHTTQHTLLAARGSCLVKSYASLLRWMALVWVPYRYLRQRVCVVVVVVVVVACVVVVGREGGE